ncbi:carbohydrate sulfotransferase 5-like [Panulirus ornatus]|uniref:carbohydrate sulfotransferase 5-like n=1 Tax=Panulirus ornatus TaxID=150431 RepID=UPI003A8A0D2D
MPSYRVVLRILRKQKVGYKPLYLVLVVWMGVLMLTHRQHLSFTSSQSFRFLPSVTGGEDGQRSQQESLQKMLLGTEASRTLPHGEVSRGLQDVRRRVLRDFLGKDLPPWLDPKVNSSQAGVGTLLEEWQIRRVLVATTWRSGSTFLGDLLNTWPGSFYHFEPFHYLTENEAVPRKLEPLATGMLKSLLTCRYDTRTRPYLEHITSARYRFLLEKNVRLATLCRRGRGICQSPGVLATACALHPLNLAKTVRLRLAALSNLLQDPSLDLRVIHLARDPRAVVQSRTKMPWCKGRSCRDLDSLCRASNQDSLKASEYSKKYPKNFLVVRYEDLVTDPYRHTRRIFEFLGLPLVAELALYIEEHAKTPAKRSDEGNNDVYAALYSTHRNSSAAVHKWRYTMAWETVREVQGLCAPSLNYYGYRVFLTHRQQENLNVSVIMAPVGTFLLE